MSHQIRISCSCCNGSGMKQVTGKYLETYDLLLQHPNSTGADLARIANISPTTMNNKLSWLEDKGLASFQQYGRKKFYFPSDLPGYVPTTPDNAGNTRKHPETVSQHQEANEKREDRHVLRLLR